MDSHLPCYDFIKLVRCMRNMLLKLFAYKKKRGIRQVLSSFCKSNTCPKIVPSKQVKLFSFSYMV